MNAGTLVTMVTLGSLACDSGRDVYQGISETTPTGSAGISTDGLVAAYDMETMTGDGRLRDFGPHDLHGRAETFHSVAGQYGSALRFDSVRYRIKLPDEAVFDQPGPVTVAAWVRVNRLDQHQHIFACDDSWALWVTPNNYYRLGDTRGSGFDSEAGALRVGAWQSVVAVLSGTRGDSMGPGTVQMYVDGRPALGSHGEVWRSAALYPSDACYLGFESHQGNERHQSMPFHGDIDDIMVFSRPLTAEEAAIHAGSGTR